MTHFFFFFFFPKKYYASYALSKHFSIKQFLPGGILKRIKKYIQLYYATVKEIRFSPDLRFIQANIY